MHAYSTRAFRSIALRTVAVTAFLSLMSPSIASVHAVDARTRAIRPPLMVGTMPERSSVASLRPRHVPASSLRTARRGDTAPSATYFQITNVTAEVDGVTGSAEAVNEDGRIGYTDFGDQEAIPPIPGNAYAVNDGTVDPLLGPYDPGVVG